MCPLFLRRKVYKINNLLTCSSFILSAVKNPTKDYAKQLKKKLCHNLQQCISSIILQQYNNIRYLEDCVFEINISLEK